MNFIKNENDIVIFSSNLKLAYKNFLEKRLIIRSLIGSGLFFSLMFFFDYITPTSSSQGMGFCLVITLLIIWFVDSIVKCCFDPIDKFVIFIGDIGQEVVEGSNSRYTFYTSASKYAYKKEVGYFGYKLLGSYSRSYHDVTTKNTSISKNVFGETLEEHSYKSSRGYEINSLIVHAPSSNFGPVKFKLTPHTAFYESATRGSVDRYNSYFNAIFTENYGCEQIYNTTLLTSTISPGQTKEFLFKVLYNSQFFPESFDKFDCPSASSDRLLLEVFDNDNYDNFNDFGVNSLYLLPTSGTYRKSLKGDYHVNYKISLRLD